MTERVTERYRDYMIRKTKEEKEKQEELFKDEKFITDRKSVV